jgi:heptosyltransferase-2
MCPRDIAKRNVQSILVIGASCLGDNLLLTPALKVIRDSFPSALIDFITGPRSSGFAEGHPWFSGVIVYRKESGLIPLIRLLRSKKYDLVVDFRNTVIPFFLRTRYTMTFFLQEFFSDKVHTHESQRVLKFLEPFFGKLSSSCLYFPLLDAELEAARCLLISEGINPGNRIVVLNPGANFLPKRWPAENFVEAGRTLAEEFRAQVIVTGGSNEVHLCESVVQAIGGNALTLAGKTTVRELAAVFSFANLVLTNDTGPMHLACAVGCPVVSVFGPGNSFRYGPIGPKTVAIRSNVKCFPCNNGDRCNRGYPCMKSIKVPEVLSACRSLLSG